MKQEKTENRAINTPASVSAARCCAGREGMVLKDGLELEGSEISAGMWMAAGSGCWGLQIAPVTCRGGTRPGTHPGAKSQSLHYELSATSLY